MTSVERANLHEMLNAAFEHRREETMDGPLCPECKGSGQKWEPAGHGRIGCWQVACLRCVGIGHIRWAQVRAHECIADEFGMSGVPAW